MYEIGVAAPSSNDRFFGSGMTCACSNTAYSANVPRARPKMRSPTLSVNNFQPSQSSSLQPSSIEQIG